MTEEVALHDSSSEATARSHERYNRSDKICINTLYHYYVYFFFNVEAQSVKLRDVVVAQRPKFSPSISALSRRLGIQAPIRPVV